MMKHCPKDCKRRNTCYRGKPIPANKDICYTPPKSKLFFTKENPDFKKHYMNMVAYAEELERELREHQGFIKKLRHIIKEGDKFSPEIMERIETLIEENPKYVN